MKLIIEKEKLEAIKNDAKNIPVWGEKSLTMATEIPKLIDHILSLCTPIEQEALQGKWISVEERLPESDKKVLVLTDKGDVTCGNYILGTMYAATDVPEFEEITHWMPLPPKP